MSHAPLIARFTRLLAPRRRNASLLACVVGACAALVPTTVGAVNTCTVSAPAHAFGAYDTINALSATSSITVTCTHTTFAAVTFSYTIKLSTGPGSYASRQMTGTGDTLTYNLYTTAAHTTVWGDGTATTGTVSGSFIVAAGAGNSGFQTQTVFGLIGANQNVRPGAYSTASNITVTVTY
jgi:spore coat protein U-like protein